MCDTCPVSDGDRQSLLDQGVDDLFYGQLDHLQQRYRSAEAMRTASIIDEAPAAAAGAAATSCSLIQPGHYDSFMRSYCTKSGVGYSHYFCKHRQIIIENDSHSLHTKGPTFDERQHSEFRAGELRLFASVCFSFFCQAFPRSRAQPKRDVPIWSHSHPPLPQIPLHHYHHTAPLRNHSSEPIGLQQGRYRTST